MPVGGGIVVRMLDVDTRGLVWHALRLHLVWPVVFAAGPHDGAQTAVPVVLTSPHSKDCQAGWNFGEAAQIWISTADLVRLGIAPSGVTPGGGSMLVNSEGITGCHNWTIKDISAPSGTDACGACNGCELGLVRFQ